MHEFIRWCILIAAVAAVLAVSFTGGEAASMAANAMLSEGDSYSGIGSVAFLFLKTLLYGGMIFIVLMLTMMLLSVLGLSGWLIGKTCSAVKSVTSWVSGSWSESSAVDNVSIEAKVMQIALGDDDRGRIVTLASWISSVEEFKAELKRELTRQTTILSGLDMAVTQLDERTSHIEPPPPPPEPKSPEQIIEELQAELAKLKAKPESPVKAAEPLIATPVVNPSVVITPN